MGVVKCRECKGKVSMKAKTCPACGAPVKRRSTILGCVGVLVLVCLASCSDPGGSSDGVPDAQSITPREQAIADAEREERAAEAAELARIAAQERKERQAKLEADVAAFTDEIEARGLNTVVARVKLHDIGSDVSMLEIAVRDTWHYSSKQIRLQAGQNLQTLWANVHAPDNPDHAHISIVDLNGNTVGGSRMWGGSLIWVQD